MPSKLCNLSTSINLRSTFVLFLLTFLIFMTQTSHGETENPKIILATSLGDIEVTLFQKEAPLTTTNILRLIDENFYDGLIFHRVIANFMIQGGGYTSELNLKDSKQNVNNESSNGLKNYRGTVAMARTNDPDSASSQFYINVTDNNHLNFRNKIPGYTVFGSVTEGMDVIDQIELVDTKLQKGMAGVPESPIIIITARRM